jgi:uncharacterized protein with PQ loop repeat
MLAAAAAVVATVLAALGLVPQVVKLVRTRVPDGVSVTWTVFGMVTNATWAIYLVAQALWLAVPSVVMVTVGYAATFVMLRRLGLPAAPGIRMGALWTATLTATGVVGGWTLLGTVLGFSYAVQVAPGLWVAYRTYRPAGIAPATWALALVEGVLWGYYGWWHADVPIMLFAVTASVASIAMLARFGATRRRLPGEELTAPATA